MPKSYQTAGPFTGTGSDGKQYRLLVTDVIIQEKTNHGLTKPHLGTRDVKLADGTGLNYVSEGVYETPFDPRQPTVTIKCPDITDRTKV